VVRDSLSLRPNCCRVGLTGVISMTCLSGGKPLAIRAEYDEQGVYPGDTMQFLRTMLKWQLFTEIRPCLRECVNDQIAYTPVNYWIRRVGWELENAI